MNKVNDTETEAAILDLIKAEATARADIDAAFKAFLADFGEEFKKLEINKEIDNAEALEASIVENKVEQEKEDENHSFSILKN